ncbi:unnamed protein product [Ectocarpus sp. CCAP 1310/34]|nr:unnamed protein product [Ectocarpus sp. CCAP 1310/34]
MIVGIRLASLWSTGGVRANNQTLERRGCLHHKLRRHHVALHYFQKALEALGKGGEAGASVSGEAAAAGRGGGKDGHVSPAPTCEVLYNTGLQLLLTDKPEEALSCFERAALLFHNRPHLWLRMAECSIARHRLSSNGVGNSGSPFTTTTNPVESKPSSAAGAAAGPDAAAGGRGPLPWTPVGKGQHRRVLLPRNSPRGVATGGGSGDPARRDRDGAIPALDEDGGGGGGGASESSNGDSAAAAAGGRSATASKRGRSTAGGGGRGCSLAHASRCLHNVLYLCAARKQGVKKAAAAGAAGLLGGQPSVLGMSTRLVAKGLAPSNRVDGGGAGAATPAGDGDSMMTEELYRVALADLAYVHLGLDDPVSALTYAGRLLETNPSAVSTHLAHLYAAEALCLLGRPAEALEHLSPISENGCSAAAAAAAASTTATDAWSSSASAVAAAAAAAGGAPKTPAAGAGGGGGGVVLSTKAAEEARASLHANLAVVHALSGSLGQAERCARTAMGICPGSGAVLRTAVYVLVRQGNIAEALQVLKEGRLSHK